MSPAYCNLLGYSREELLERPVSGVVPSLRTEDLSEAGSCCCHALHRLNDSTVLQFEISIHPLVLFNESLFLILTFPPEEYPDYGYHAQAMGILNTQKVISSLLYLSLGNIPLENFLNRALHFIFSVPWLSSVSKGCIYLVEDDPQVLVMKAEQGFEDFVKRKCARLPFGEGACGRAALTHKIHFSDRSAYGGCEEGEPSSEEKPSEGVYGVPILCPGGVLGVISVHVEDGHRRHQREEEYLMAIANALAGIIIRKRAQESLVQSEARYRAIVEDQTELISRFRPDGTLTFVNDAYCRYFGESRDELIHRRFWHHVPQKDRRRLREYFASLGPEKPLGMIEHRVQTKTGEVRWQQWTDRAIMDRHGNVVEFQSVGRDISERKRGEKALRESEERLRLLSSQLIMAQEKERKRIACELHDGISQALTAIKFSVENTLGQIHQGNAVQSSQSLEDVIRMVQLTIEEVRRIMTDLRPSILDDLGIVTTIGWFCREFQKVYSGIGIERQIEVQENEVSDPLKIVIFRVLQEAMNNIAKHSGAHSVRIALKKSKNRIELTIEDDGEGFNTKKALSMKDYSGGLGLSSMKERTELSGGLFSIETAEGEGTLIRASWPCA